MPVSEFLRILAVTDVCHDQATSVLYEVFWWWRIY